jgi:hypothetical protein
MSVLQLDGGSSLLLLICVGVPSAAFILYLAIDGIRSIVLRRRLRRLR